MKIQNNFLKATINKDFDERLTPNGQLIDAQNFMVTSEDNSGAGVGKNVIGNLQSSDLGIVGGETIGSVADDSRDKIYYFHKGDLFDYVIEWDLDTKSSEIVLQSTTNGALNFSLSNRITHIDLFLSDEESYLLSWTDGINPPRIINIDRAKTYGLDGFTSEEISVIKAPPSQDLSIIPKQTTHPTGSNFMEDKFLSFAYRYKYKDGYFSAISSFTEPVFIPRNFELDLEVGENLAMVNSANAVDITFNTGSRDVIGVDLLFRESNTSTVFIIEKYKKEDKGWSDLDDITIEFNNSKVYLPLPESQYLRNFDNVPLSSVTQSKTGNRLTYGNFIEGRDIDTVIDYNVGFSNSNASNLNFDTNISNCVFPSKTFSNLIDIEEVSSVSGTDGGDMDAATNILTKTMATDSRLEFSISVSLRNISPLDTAKIIVTDNDVEIKSSTVFNTGITYDFIIENTSLIDTKDVSLKFYVVKESGDVIHDTVINVSYLEGVTLIYEYDYSANFQESYYLDGSLVSTLYGDTMNYGEFSIYFGDFEFKKNSFIFIDYVANSNLNEDVPDINTGIFYIIEDDYIDVNDFYNNSGFVDSIENVTTGHSALFENSFIGSNGSVEEFIGFKTRLVGGIIYVCMPYTKFEVTDGFGTYNVEELYRINSVESYASSDGAFSSMHSNRDYEACMIYMDKESRKTTALVSDNNTVFIPTQNSITQNKITVDINHDPPSWADRYKFAIKQTKGNYETIYGTVFYIEGSYVWLKITGSSKEKIKEGDTLIVKRDTNEYVLDEVKTTVLAIEDKPYNFIEGNNNERGIAILEEDGTYFKVLPRDFNLEYRPDTFLNMRNFGASYRDRPFTHTGVNVWEADDPSNPYVLANSPTVNHQEPYITYTVTRAKILNGLSYYDNNTDTIIDTPIPTGSSVSLILESVRSGRENAKHKEVYYATTDYDNFEDFFANEIQGELPLNTNLSNTYDNVSVVRGYVYYADFDSNNYPEYDRIFVEDPFGYLFLKVEGVHAGNGTTRRGRLTSKVEIRLVNDFIVFETEPDDLIDAPFYETPETFKITNGEHVSGTHTLTKAFNCFSFGNGVESYQIKDKFNEKYVSLNAIPTQVSEDEYRQIHRYADLTYGGVYQPSTNINSLNEFNLSTANYKDDVEKRYGSIQRLFPTETDLLVIQEDKWSKVLYGKDVLFNTDATTNLSRIAEVLGQQVMYGGEYGISTFPESFDKYAFDSFGADVKRGVVMKLNNSNGLKEISSFGMTDYFKRLFRDNKIDNIIGEYDAFYDIYLMNIKYTDSEKNSKYVTWIFSPKDKGFLTTQTFNPDDMVRLNNQLISFKGGDVYLHNSGAYNTFYGEKNSSKFSFNFSQDPSTRKLFRTIAIEGTDSWDIDLKTDLQNGFVNKIDFKNKEGVWYAYNRGNETEIDTATMSIQGIGQISNINGNTIEFISDIPNIFSVGDSILNTSLSLIGNSISSTSNSISLDSVIGLSVGDFVLSAKSQSSETSGLLGYYMRVDAELNSDNYSEVYSVNSEVSKSFE